MVAHLSTRHRHFAPEGLYGMTLVGAEDSLGTTKLIAEANQSEKARVEMRSNALLLVADRGIPDDLARMSMRQDFVETIDLGAMLHRGHWVIKKDVETVRAQTKSFGDQARKSFTQRFDLR